MNLEHVVKTIRLANAAFSNDCRQQIENAGSALSSYAASEVQYSSAVARVALWRILEIGFCCALINALFLGFVVAAIMTTFTVDPGTISTMSPRRLMTIVTIAVTSTGIGIIWYVMRRSRELTVILESFFNHWKLNDATQFKQ